MEGPQIDVAAAGIRKDDRLSIGRVIGLTVDAVAAREPAGGQRFPRVVGDFFEIVALLQRVENHSTRPGDLNL